MTIATKTKKISFKLLSLFAALILALSVFPAISSAETSTGSLYLYEDGLYTDEGKTAAYSGTGWRNESGYLLLENFDFQTTADVAIYVKAYDKNPIKIKFVSGVNTIKGAATAFNTQGGDYTIELDDSLAVTTDTTGALITEPKTVKVTASPDSTTALLNASVTLTAAANYSNFAYQWYVTPDGSTASGQKIDGAISATYAPSTAAEGSAYYYCVIDDKITSNVVQLSVYTGLSITTDSQLPEADIKNSYKVQLEAAGSGPVAWSVKSGSFPTWANLDVKTGIISGNPDTTGTWTFVIGVTNGVIGDAEKSFTVTAVNRVYDFIDVTDGSVTSVVVSPANVTLNKGESQPFTAVVSGNNPSQAVTWYVTGGVSDTTISADGVLKISANETAAMLTVRAVSNANTSVYGLAAVTVGTASSVNAPVIVSQPENRSAAAGTTTSFTAAAAGSEPLTYQWQVNRNDGNSYVNLNGANATTYNTAVVTDSTNGYIYRCVVTNAYGSATSNSATLTVVTGTVPKTGDTAQTLLLAAAILLALGALAAIAIYRKHSVQ